MSVYKFATNRFGISEDGIHLLRSGYNYKTVLFSELQSVTIGRGRQVSNWLVALLFGAGLVFFGSYVLAHAIYAYFMRDDIYIMYVEQFVIPVIPLIIGFYTVFISLRNGATLKVMVNSKAMSLPAEELQKQGQLQELIFFLTENPLTKPKFHAKSKSN
jgi:hypothetical protein